jgi:V8-like Glu-specific endopeptidase
MVSPTSLEILPPWWDEDYYLQNHSDVAAAVREGFFNSGLDHFEQHGMKEGRDPNLGFNTQYYLEQNPDVAEALRNGSLESAFQHWLLYGQQENRQATPNGIIIPQKTAIGTQTEPALANDSQSGAFNGLETQPGLLHPNQSANPTQVIQYDPVTKTQSILPLQSNPVDGNDINQYLKSAGFEGIEDFLQTLGTPAEFESKLNSDTPKADKKDSTVGIEPGTVFGPDDRVKINNTTDYPWATIGQITMRFGDTSYLGSGAMISPYHFLTAGHNIFDPNTGQWASNVKINLGRNGSDRFFGEANPTVIRTYTAWAYDNNPQHDWALITLDRNIGNTTGWLGYEWRGNSSDYNGMIVNTAGYPGDKGGNDMYYATGPVAYASDYQLHYNGTMDTFGGQSGSPVWRYDSGLGQRYINAVHAYGNGGDGYNKGTRINQDKFNSLQSWTSEDNNNWLPTDRPDLVDYDAWFNTNYASFSATSITPGSNFSARSVVRNNGTSAAGNFTVSFYASTDTNITTSDYLIGNTTISSLNPFNWSYADWSGSFPNIPSGNYYVGWLIDSANSQVEFVEDNNTGVITSNPLTVVASAAPGNDNFINRINLSSRSTTGTNVDATAESGEPNHGGRPGGKSVWWSWTAPASGNFTLSTAGSNYDTLLGLYTGSNVAHIPQI